MKRISEEEAYRLAAISTISLSNTRETFDRHRIDENHEAWTVAYSDVERAVEREICLIEKLALTEKALRIAAGTISTLPQYAEQHPEDVYDEFIHYAEEDTKNEAN